MTGPALELLEEAVLDRDAETDRAQLQSGWLRAFSRGQPPRDLRVLRGGTADDG